MDRRFISILVVIALIFAGFLVFNQKNSTSGTGGNSSASSKPSNHVIGEGKKHVTLIEYGDYQCPACGQYYPIVKQVQLKYNSDIVFQFRNFPLESLHPNARAGARAAEAAGMQGKYWEMHDKLYETQQQWAQLSDVKTAFESIASQLGLNMTKFRTDYASDTVNSTINADIGEGQKIGANSTPTFVLDGKKIDQNPRSLDEFYKLIDEEIAVKNPGAKTTPNATKPVQ